MHPNQRHLYIGSPTQFLVKSEFTTDCELTMSESVLIDIFADLSMNFRKIQNKYLEDFYQTVDR